MQKLLWYLINKIENNDTHNKNGNKWIKRMNYERIKKKFVLI